MKESNIVQEPKNANGVTATETGPSATFMIM